MKPQAETRITQARGLILAAALLSFGLSVVLFFTGEERAASVVGRGVPSSLARGGIVVRRVRPCAP